MLRLRVCVDGEFGYVDASGDIAIPLEYHFAGKFSDGFAAIWRKGENTLHVIDTEGRIRGSVANVNSYSRFSEELLSFFTYKDGELGSKGYIDTQARMVIPPTFLSAFDFIGGVASVKLNDKYGVIDRQGKWVIRPRFNYMRPFGKGEDVTAFEEDGLWGLVDRAGKTVIEPRYHDAKRTCRGLTPVCVEIESEDFYGLVDNRGEWVVPPKYEACGDEIYEETFAVAVDEKWGVIDLDGNWVIPPQYTCTESFHEGLCRVYVGGHMDLDNYLADGQFGYVNRAGELVIPAQFDEAYDFEDGVAEVQEFAEDDPYGRKTKIGWIDKTGKFIWKPTR